MAIEKDKSIVATEIVDALNKKVNTSGVLTLEEIKATEDLAGKVASASALKKVIIKASLYQNYTTDSNGNIYVGFETSKYRVLSAVIPGLYFCNICVYEDGSMYYVKVFNLDGTVARDASITYLYVYYTEI